MKNEINLGDIRAFVVIAKAGSFTGAAQILACSRSQLSKQLLQLESILGIKLITRTTRSQRLTQQGKQFFEHCSRSLDGINFAVEQVMDDANAMRGELNINCVGGYIGEEIIAPLVSRFKQMHPDIVINLDFTSKRVDLVSGEFDLVFRMGMLEDSNLIARKVLDIPIVTLASPQYLQKNTALSHPKDLKEHQCIVGSMNRWSFTHKDTATKKVEVSVTGSFKSKNGRVMLHSALAANGIVRLPTLYCQQEIANGSLVPVFTDWIIPNTPLYLVYLQDKFQPARLKSFISFINENIESYNF